MSCQHHDDGACCTACTEHTDGFGFPCTGDAGGRRPLRQCLLCEHWVARSAWTVDSENGVSCCNACIPAAYERIAKHLEGLLSGSAALRRAKIKSAIDKVRARARVIAIR